ncbi:hypothetical protein [Stigmatella hybrida]|uniref:hypothetical protein n=1 Tax=Stigmatella hybrida TaxID=394097 RepID=UPI001CDA8B0E|nr:hypothetical protein [Stigmatella hybrida]
MYRRAPSRRPPAHAGVIAYIQRSAVPLSVQRTPPGKNPEPVHGQVQAKASLDMLGSWP